LEYRFPLPTYTYTCTSCNDLIEKRQSFSDPPLTTCEQCGGSLRKVFHPVGIVFKGSGWYVTDSRTTSNNGATTPPKTDTDKPATKKDDAAAEPATTTSTTSTTTATTSTPSPAKDAKD
jgi:putative FmdB family regulatory protein